MARRYLGALLCCSGAQAAAAVLGSGLRGSQLLEPWEDDSHPVPTPLTPEEEQTVDEYRALKLQQLTDRIATGKMPIPLPGEQEKKDLWDRFYRHSAHLESDRKVQLFLNEQTIAFIGTNHSFAQAHKGEKNATAKVTDFFGNDRKTPVKQSNGTRYVALRGRNNTFAAMKLYHMHIPRTGGTSFAADSHKMVVNNATLSMFSKEGCYNWKSRFDYVDGVVTMVRNPRAHVLSQYLYCSKGPISGFTSVHKLELWIKDWNKRPFLVGDYGSRSHTDWQIFYQKFVTHTMLPYHCYNPVNLQVQHFTCRGGPFNYSGKVETELAIQNMQDTYFVGVNEAYQESICLFYIKVHGELPRFCDCKNRTNWQSFNASHNGHYLTKPTEKQHSVQSMRPEVRDMVDNITRADWQLYKAAVARFAKEVHEAEQRFNTTIMCEDRLSRQLHQEDDPVQRDFSLYMQEARATLKARL